MLGFVTRTALGLSIIAVGLAVAAPASANQHRLLNADKSNGYFYLGIPPGPQNGHVLDDQTLVIWNYSQNDQIWNVPEADGYGQFSDYYTDPNGSSVCITVSSDGLRLIDHTCDGTQLWQIFPSYKVGLENTYPNCYIVWNINTGKAMGVKNRLMQNGTQVVQWDYDGSANQFWCW